MKEQVSVINNPKLIGVCMSQAHTFLKDDFLCVLEQEARKSGYGLLVFNSSMDWYWSHHGGNITGCVYDMIRYDRLSALVILHGNIYDTEQLDRMIRRARAECIPVLYLGGRHPLCDSIVDDYKYPYKEMIRHIIREHRVSECFYIAGLKDEDNSRLRLRCWKEVMEEFGLPCGESHFAYGNYLDTDALQILHTLLEKRGRPPRAILCANDSMASAVCDDLFRRGFRVPENVIVAGFDGIPSSYIMQPQLTTCDSNPEELAALVMERILSFDPKLQPQDEPVVLTHTYRTVLAESCGCPAVSHSRFSALKTLQQAKALSMHENTMFYAIDQLLEEKDLYSFLQKIGEMILPGSALYLNQSLLETDADTEHMPDHPEEDLIMIPYCKPGETPALRKVHLRDMPLPSRESSGITIINIVHSDVRVCGYYAAHTDNLPDDSQLIKRLSDVMNLIASVQLGRMRQLQLVARLENNMFVDSVTGLSNLKGLSRWYEHYTEQESVRDRMLALSVYVIPRYSWICETYGIAEAEEAIRAVARTLIAVCPEALHIARVSEDQFAVIDAPTDETALSTLIIRCSAAFTRQIEQFNAGDSRPYILEVSDGHAHLDRKWKAIPLDNLLSLAVGDIYLNRLREGKTDAGVLTGVSDAQNSAFNLLMEKNLFRFHFQPIVDARSGLVCAYEALMRTDSIINMTPLEILRIARENGRLYDVERATVFGIMERFVRNYSDFNGCKVFINTIPGYFLSAEDCSALINKYESFLDCFVFELTEDSPTSDDELARLKRVCKPGAQTQIAIDDFGAGHSNILNLLRYSPQIIKIDRGLISGIAADANRRLFVRNTIEFAHQNGIRALAEGVETSEELRAVIECGVDLIQGFYTGRPSEKPIRTISEKVLQEIRYENFQLAQGDHEFLFYEPSPGEDMNLLDLATGKYSCLFLREGEYVLRGEKSNSVDMNIRIADNANVRLQLSQVNLNGTMQPCIRLGSNSTLELELDGQNTLNKDGIFVPGSARLYVRGKGNLLIHSTRNYAVGIGANYTDPYGTICLENEGMIAVRSSGDKTVCIGGGISGGDGILIRNGSLDLNAGGINVVGIGSSAGSANIEISDIDCSIRVEGNETLLIGSMSGSADIRMSGDYRLYSASERTTAIGTMSGTADVLISGGVVMANIRCDSGAVIGTFNGEAKVVCRDTAIRIHGEGNCIAGFGSLSGACDTRVESGEIRGDLLAGERLLLGNNHSRFMVTGGNIRLFQDCDNVPVSPCGAPLTFITPEGDHFEQTFTDRRATWTYKADRSKDGYLGVWIPF